MTLEVILLVAGIPGLSSAIEMQPRTLKAWDDYIQNAGVRMQSRVAGHRPFLWTDEAADQRARIQGGEIRLAASRSRTGDSLGDVGSRVSAWRRDGGD